MLARGSGAVLAEIYPPHSALAWQLACHMCRAFPYLQGACGL